MTGWVPNEPESPLVSATHQDRRNVPAVGAAVDGNARVALVLLRRGVQQSRVDALDLARAAKKEGDQVRTAHFVGKTQAYQAILDMIDIEIDNEPEQRSVGRPASRRAERS
ncbi:hypothetical protein [Fodinicola feengrottensis]|uniref:Ankyrin repeat domain-containing protein n=1 Tax=Fodinicola feengrottensis TaxID=435914 RepID=A0ABN2J7M4_9ACTN|nr:hypothetical protein [Fodinicola feengrottensis]